MKSKRIADTHNGTNKSGGHTEPRIRYHEQQADSRSSDPIPSCVLGCSWAATELPPSTVVPLPFESLSAHGLYALSLSLAVNTRIKSQVPGTR